MTTDELSEIVLKVCVAEGEYEYDAELITSSHKRRAMDEQQAYSLSCHISTSNDQLHSASIVGALQSSPGCDEAHSCTVTALVDCYQQINLQSATTIAMHPL